MFTVCGSVGLVEPGITFGSPAIERMSGACPPPAPSTWNAWIDRPAMAAIVDSTNPASLSESECNATCRPQSSAACNDAPIAAGVDPQSSCTLYPAAPASACSLSAATETVLPLPSSRMLIGNGSSARCMFVRCQAPGVTVVAFDPSDGPVPPPTIVVMPVASASWICDCDSRCTCESIAPAGTIRTILSSRMPISARTIPHQSRMIAFVMTVSRAPSARLTVDCAMDSRIDLPPPNTASSPPTVRSCSI